MYSIFCSLLSFAETTLWTKTPAPGYEVRSHSKAFQNIWTLQQWQEYEWGLCNKRKHSERQEKHISVTCAVSWCLKKKKKSMSLDKHWNGGWEVDCPSKKPEEMSCRKAYNLDRERYLFFFFSPNQFLSPLVPLLNSLAAMLSMHSFKHLFLLCLIFSPFSSGFHSVFYLLLLPMPSPPFLFCSLFSFNAQHLCVFFSAAYNAFFSLGHSACSAGVR